MDMVTPNDELRLRIEAWIKEKKAAASNTGFK
jgi:hypothetical protein